MANKARPVSAPIDLDAAREAGKDAGDRDRFGRQPSYVTVIAGASGSGKSLSLARIAKRFTRQYPDSPVRILDVGRSAEPLAELWR